MWLVFFYLQEIPPTKSWPVKRQKANTTSSWRCWRIYQPKLNFLNHEAGCNWPSQLTNGRPLKNDGSLGILVVCQEFPDNDQEIDLV